MKELTGMMKNAPKIFALSAAIVLVAGCEPEQQVPVVEDKRETCTSSDQCPSGEVCKEGLCIIGDCVVREDCPKPNDQLCNELNRCVPDPDSPIGNQCPNGDRDCDMGEFCSAGTCYDVASSETCSRSSDCSAGSRCDPINGFCVEDRGGCNRGDEYPELACPEGDVCDALTGHCEPPTGIPCTPETELEDCGEALRCLGSRCVQCTSNTSCGEGDNICCDGFGTQCNVATGRCVSAFVCSDHPDCTDCLQRPGLGDQSYCSDGHVCGGDADCSHLTDRRCAASTGECIRPECVDDSECRSEHDSRWVCDPATFRCFLPPATCEETNEPNNAMSTASVVSGTEHSDVLCRGDVDVLQIQGHANTRLRVTVGISPSGGSGIIMVLRDSAGTELDSTTFGYSSQASVAADVAADAPFFLTLQGNATDNDEYSYTVTIVETEPLECDSELGEPNETLEQASNSVLTQGAHARALCGADDEDYHHLVAPAGLRTVVTISFIDDDGDIDVRLLSLTGDTLDSSTGTSDTEELRYSGGLEDETIALRVYRYSGIEEQEYLIEFSTEELPDCDDGYEPNDQEGSATAIGVGTYQANICSIDDSDFYEVALPGGGDITATTTFIDADGNLQLALREAGGYAIDTSTDWYDDEYVEGMDLDPGLYYIEVYSSSYSYPEPDRQPYTLDVTVNHYCFDDDLEGWGNNSLEDATPVRDEALSSFAIDETLVFCGEDDDWFRMLLIGDEFVSLRATGPVGIFAELYRLGSDGPERVALSQGDPAADPGEATLGYHVPGRGAIYYLRLGRDGSEETNYDLQLLASADPCGEDGNEYNDVPEHATPVPSEGLDVNGELCPVDDVDLFGVAVIAGTEVEVALSFDADVADADLVAHQGGAEVAASRTVNSAGAATENISFTASEAGQLLLSVERAPGSAEAALPYGISVGVVGGPVEDAGYVDDAAAGLDAGFEDVGVVDAGSEDAASEDVTP